MVHNVYDVSQSGNPLNQQLRPHWQGSMQLSVNEGADIFSAFYTNCIFSHFSIQTAYFHTFLYKLHIFTLFFTNCITAFELFPAIVTRLWSAHDRDVMLNYAFSTSDILHFAYYLITYIFYSGLTPHCKYLHQKCIGNLLFE